MSGEVQSESDDKLVNSGNSGLLKSGKVIEAVDDTVITTDSLVNGSQALPKEITDRLDILNGDTIKFLIKTIAEKSIINGQLMNWRDVNSKFDLSNLDSLEISLLEAVLYGHNPEIFEEYKSRKNEIIDTYGRTM